jgi:hypothetical protein
MILKGNQRAGGEDLASHLMNLYDNDAVELAQVKGTIAQDLHGAFAEFEAMAIGTRAREALYSLSINPGEKMSREQYFTAIDRVEDRLGLSGQPRAVVFHVKGGREHCHVVWSRIDTGQMKAVQLSHDRQKLRAVARELGQEFGHELPAGMRSDRGAQRFENDAALSVAELAVAEASGLSADARRKEITSAYREARDAQGFIDGLWERGYHLARGDQRGFVVVDKAGHVHSLSRQVIGAKAKDIAALLSPLTPENLPSVKETRQRIADQIDSDALDENVKPHLRRSPEELKQRQAERRAALHSEWQKVEFAQAEERMQLHAAQKRERERPFARAARSVLGLFGKLPVLRTVLGAMMKNPSLNLEERQRLENEALDRRYERERQTLDRRLKALAKVEAREDKSMARDQRRLDAAKDRMRGQAVDEFGKAVIGPELSKGQEQKPELKKEPEGPKKSKPRGFTMKP